MRLQVDPTHPDLIIGDTPNIHDFPLPRNSLSTQAEVLTENFGTIDLQRVTGLTLFFAKGYKLVHIHGHTRERPLAEPPRDILTETQLHELKWVYVSFPRWKYALSISRAYSSSSVASSESSPSGSSSIVSSSCVIDKKCSNMHILVRNQVPKVSKHSWLTFPRSGRQDKTCTREESEYTRLQEAVLASSRLFCRWGVSRGASSLFRT